MKKSKLFSCLFALMAITFFGAGQAFGQDQDLEFINNGECDLRINLVVVNVDDCSTCTTGTYCVSPGQTFIPGCSNTNPAERWRWARITVEAFDVGCVHPCSKPSATIDNHWDPEVAQCGFTNGQPGGVGFEDCCAGAGLIKWESGNNIVYLP